METVIFETHDRFPKKVFDKEGLILSFNRQNLNLIKTADGDLTRLNKSDSWICAIADNPDLVKRAKKHKSFESKFWIVNKVPTKKDFNTIAVKGPQTSTSGSIMDSVVKEMKEKAMKFGELRTKVLKSDGTYYSSAKPNEIEEYEKLKKELNE